MKSDGSDYRYFRRAAGARDWIFDRETRRTDVTTNSPDFDVVAAGPNAGTVYVFARTPDRDLTAVHLLNTATGELGPALYQAATSDVAQIFLDEATRRLIVACDFARRFACRGQEAGVQAHLNAINGFFEGSATVSLREMSRDGRRWLLYVHGPADPGAYYLYDRAERRVEPLALTRPGL